MKKHDTKKLTLSRETVRNLAGAELGKIAGGLQQVGIVSSDNQECSYSRQCPDTW